ncbi:uncharacterized protein LOC135811682 [Sycon ciliatum]|uniref:uncharacterized protein LOC135811682 n=1 Tax=Sycon ciliatum TaxID=27933 RepID=UPI0031F5FB42
MGQVKEWPRGFSTRSWILVLGALLATEGTLADDHHPAKESCSVSSDTWILIITGLVALVLSFLSNIFLLVVVHHQHRAVQKAVSKCATATTGNESAPAYPMHITAISVQGAIPNPDNLQTELPAYVDVVTDPEPGRAET